jgi:hypothetical protein
MRLLCHTNGARSTETYEFISTVSFNLLPGQCRVGGARHAGFAGEQVAGCWAFAAAFGPAGPGAGGFRDTGGWSRVAADVAKPPADPARWQRTGRIGVLFPGPAEVGGQGTGEQELGAGGHEEPGPAVGLLRGADFRGGWGRERL